MQFSVCSGLPKVDRLVAKQVLNLQVGLSVCMLLLRMKSQLLALTTNLHLCSMGSNKHVSERSAWGAAPQWTSAH